MSPWTFFVNHRAEILDATLDHLGLVLIAMAIAVAIAVPLGMVIVHRPALRNFSLGVASVLQTIPSLALFGFLIPIPFIGGIGRTNRDCGAGVVCPAADSAKHVRRSHQY